MSALGVSYMLLLQAYMIETAGKTEQRYNCFKQPSST